MTRIVRKHPTLAARSLPRLVVATVVAAVVLVGLGAADAAGPSPAQKCSAAKQKAAGKKGACKLNCTAKAALAGLPLNAPTVTTCLGKCDPTFNTAFTKAEAKGRCHTTGDVTTIEGKVDAFIMDVANALPAEGGVTPCVQPFHADARDILDGFSFGLDNRDVPASCGGSTPLCCPGGVPVSPCGPLQFDFVPRAGESSMILVSTSDPDRFDADVPVRVKTVTDLPVTIPLAGECGLQIDTSAGPSPTIRIQAPVFFSADRLRMGPVGSVTLIGLTSDDFTITGGLQCQAANAVGSIFIGILARVIEGNLRDTDQHLCLLCSSNAIAQCGP